MCDRQGIPLLQMFALCAPQGAALEAAQSCTIWDAAIHQSERSVELAVSFSHTITQEQLTAIRASCCAAYGLCDVVFRIIQPEEEPKEVVKEPEKLFQEGDPITETPDQSIPWENSQDAGLNDDIPLPEEIPPELEVIATEPYCEEIPPWEKETPKKTEDVFAKTEAMRQEALRKTLASRPAVPAKKKDQLKTNVGMILGKSIRTKPIPMSEVRLDLRRVTVTGKVFAIDHKELKKRNAWVIRFHMTDNTNSVTVSKFMENREAKPILEKIKKGMYVTVEGKLGLYNGDLELSPFAIAEAEAPSPRTDQAEEKRVELHLHTRFSKMDALTEVKDAVKRAVSWGHKAIAITDHGVAQAFPDAASAAGGKIKVIYGVEGYFVNDVDDRIVVHGHCPLPLDTEIVCFDIETTGLNRKRDLITEIGAVVLKNGEVVDDYNTFVNPGRPIPRNIVELTGITDSMVANAPGQEDALNAFLDWVGDRPLAAHNAEFDTGFLAEGCARMGRPFSNPSIDTLILAQNLLPDLGKYKLDIVAERLNLPAFNHHRACDDAAVVGYMLMPFQRMLRDLGIEQIDQINQKMQDLRSAVKRRQKPGHIILLAKNQSGLRNLYKLISLSHLEHFQRFPIIPKSLINENREGLIIGSACAAGELFNAILDHKNWQELRRIASWYDFLEIQPICNNFFLLDKGTIADEEELRELNRTVFRLGQELGKPVCATGDVHFLDPEQEQFRRILLNANGFSDADKELPIYFKTTDEMLEEFSYLGERECHKVVIDDPNFIAKMCDVIPPLPKGLFAPKLENSAQELEQLVYEKAHRLYGDELPEIVRDRIDLELPGIIQRKYDVIYMSAQKLVADSMEHGYLVGSRGSVGSSIVAFLSGITEVNSLPPHYRCPNCQYSDFDTDIEKYGCGADLPDKNCPHCGTLMDKDGFNIPFETFLGYGGTKVPDIDLNFSGEYQAKAHQHTFELFGESHVFKAGTVGTVAEQTAYGYVLKYLEERNLQVSKAEEARLAAGCTNVRRTTGQHPGGMVVIPGNKEIYDFCPVQHPADDPHSDIITTHFEYHSMEDNLLKLDMLGHDDPTMIKMLQDLTGVDPQKIRLDDKDTMSIFCSSKVLGFENDPILGPTGSCGIPEFGTGFTRGMLIDTQPKNFDTLLRLSGFSHGTDVWLGNAKDLILSGTASVTEAIGCRDDIMLYLISMGVDELRSFKFMEAVRKGVIHKGKSWPDGIVEEMQEHNIPEWYIESCRKIKYLFPKAHAVAYVTMAFRIAWFKVHRPLAFYSAYFSIRAKAVDATCMCLGMEVCKEKMAELKAKDKITDVEDKMYTTLEMCYEFYLRGFTFGKMDLYKSAAKDFLMDEANNILIPPFVSIPGLGEAAAESIVEQRQGREFISVEELVDACPKVSKAHVEQLRHMGALDDIPDTSQITLFSF